MKFIQFSYKGDKWHCYLIPHEETEEFFENDDSAAEVQFDKKEIYVSDQYIKDYVIAHEVFHMATGYQYVQDSNLTLHQAEELFCNLFAYEGKKLLELSKVLYDKLVLLQSDNKLEEIVLNE